MVPELLILALAFYRAPLRFSHLTDTAHPLPEAFGKWLAESSNALAPGRIQSTAAALGTRPDELQQAFLFFLRQTLLSPRADHYRVLGLTRRSSEASVKQHYSLLVRLFHPDRTPDEDERNSTMTARINAAYHILRDPLARQRYDRRLPPLPRVAQPGAEVADFFRPRDPGAQLEALRTQYPPIMPHRLRWAVPWALVASAILLLIALLFKPEQPMLRVNPELATERASGPHFLKAGSPHPIPTRDTDRVESKPIAAANSAPDPIAPSPTNQAAQVPSPGTTAPRADQVPPESAPHEPRAAKPVDPPPSRPQQGISEIASPKDQKADPRTKEKVQAAAALGGEQRAAAPAFNPSAASTVVSRLERSFANGDLAGLRRLFTANAVFNSGVGPDALRQEYAKLFGSAQQRRVTISDLRWQTAGDQRLVAKGRIRVGRRSAYETHWYYRNGPIALELVPWMGDYRISKMSHRLDP